MSERYKVHAALYIYVWKFTFIKLFKRIYVHFMKVKVCCAVLNESVYMRGNGCLYGKC